MAQEIETTGTTPPDDGDAAAQADDRDADEAGRDAPSREPDYKQLYLESKDKIEDANRIMRAAAEREFRNEQPPAAQANPNDDAEDPRWTQAKAFAAKGDPVAQLLLEERDERERLAHAMGSTYELLDIEDRAERREVAELLRKNPNRGLDIRAARSEIRSAKLERENADLRSKLEASRDRPVRASADAVRTAGREITADKFGTTTMTASEFDRRVDELRAAGDHKGAMKLQAQLNDNAIKLKIGQ